MKTTVIAFAIKGIKKLRDLGAWPALGGLLAIYLIWSYNDRANTIDSLQEDLRVEQQNLKNQARQMQRIQEEYISAQQVRLALEQRVSEIDESTDQIQYSLVQDIDAIRNEVRQEVQEEAEHQEESDHDIQAIVQARIIDRVGQRVLDSMWDAHCRTVRDEDRCTR